MIPRFNPYYTQVGERTFVNDDNETWQQDALAGLTHWINGGVSSISWDHFMYKTVDGQKPALIGLIEKVRDLARARGPESTLGSESVDALELDSSILDFTLNWVDYVDSVLGEPTSAFVRRFELVNKLLVIARMLQPLELAIFEIESEEK